MNKIETFLLIFLTLVGGFIFGCIGWAEKKTHDDQLAFISSAYTRTQIENEKQDTETFIKRYRTKQTGSADNAPIAPFEITLFLDFSGLPKSDEYSQGVFLCVTRGVTDDCAYEVVARVIKRKRR